MRVWKNDGADVPLPSPDNDVIIVFTHFLQHFFVGGVGLRQICDWCRLLWTYRDSIDRGLLERRLKEMGIVSEWQAFGAFVVEYCEGGNGELNGELNDSQKATLAFIKKHEGCRAAMIAEEMGIPFSTIDKHIRVLLKTGAIERRGSKKTGGYYAMK